MYLHALQLMGHSARQRHKTCLTPVQQAYLIRSEISQNVQVIQTEKPSLCVYALKY